MKKKLKLPVRFEKTQYDEQTCFEMFFNSDAICAWCLGLSLLKEGLVEELVIEPLAGQLKLELQVDPSVPVGRIPGHLKSDIVTLRLSPATVDYLLVFCLKYYRDGRAEVDHIDLESSFKELDDNVDVILKFSDAAPPMSSEEARKLLEC